MNLQGDTFQTISAEDAKRSLSRARARRATAADRVGASLAKPAPTPTTQNAKPKTQDTATR